MQCSKIMSMILAVVMAFSVLAAFPMSSGAAAMDDATFFSKLNYSAYSELEPVRAAVSAGNYTAAKAELLKYFKERKKNSNIQGFGVSEADEFYAMAVLPMRNILTGPYEFDMWQGEFTVTSSSFNEYRVDITQRVMQELNNGAVSFMLMAGDKQQYPVLVKSKEAGGEAAPKLSVTYEKDGVQNTAVITANNDTYISSGNTGTAYGSAVELYVKEDGEGSSATGSNTRRTYINFPLDTVANSTIVSAELVLNAAFSSDCNTGDKDVLVINVGDTMWSEGTLTWTNTSGSIYSYQNAAVPTWGADAPNANSEYHNVTSRFWFGKPMAYEYLSYLKDPKGYNASHPYSDVYPGAEFGPKLVELMNAFASQKNYGWTRTLETGERLNRWVDIVDAFLETDVFDTRLDEFVNILSFMWGDCNYLSGLNIADGGPWWSNWRIVANAGFFKAVEYLPEFLNHDAWRSKVEGNVEWTLNYLYNDDMSFTEAGPSYNVWCVKLFGDCIRAAEMSGNPMSDLFIAKVRYAARNALESYYPNGYDTNIGDSNYRDQMHYFENLDIAFKGVDSIIRSYVTGSDEGAEYLSSYYPSVNSAYMRNTWDPDEAVYVNFTNNPNDGHYHPDSNQVLMYAYGQPLIVDSGRYSYSNTNSIYNELRNASAHSTVEAVGVSMGSHAASAAPGTMTYTSNKVFDFASDEQHGYSGVSHTRNVLYMRDGFAIVTDYVKGSNANQEYRQNWHFLPSSNAAVDGSVAKTNFYHRPNIVIANAGSDAEILNGYHSADYGLVANSKYASFVRTGATVKFDTVLYPTRAGESADITVADLASGDLSKASLLIEGDLSGYYYVKNTDASDGTFGHGELYTDAKMAYAMNNEYAMISGTTFDVQSGSLISSPAVIDSISLRTDNGTLYVDGENLVQAKNEETAIKLGLGAITKVVLNGEEIELKTDADGNVISVASSNIAGTVGDVVIGNKAYNVIGENIVPDGGFEDANGNFSWGTWESPNGSNGYFKNKCEDWFYKVNRDTNASALYMSGSITAEDYALGTRWNDGTYGLCSMANFIPVEKGKTYYISYDYKHKNNNVGTGYIMTSFKANRDNYESGANHYIPDAATTQWKKAETVITAPEDGYIYFHFRWLGSDDNKGDGPYWYFDNFNVAEAEMVENIYYEPATVSVVSVLRSEGEVTDTIVGESTLADVGTFYTASPAETINHNGKIYVINRESSSLITKVADGKNIITVYYDETKDSPVTVSYIDEDGAPVKNAAELMIPYGEIIDKDNIPFEETIVGSSKAYVFSEAYGLGEASDGEDKNVVLVYEAFDIETKTVSAVKSTTVAGDRGTYSNYSTSGEDKIPARMMMDNRSNSGKNRFSLIDIGEISPDVIKVTMLLKELESGGSYGGTYSAYDASGMGTSWSPTSVSGATISGSPVGSGSASGTTVTFDLTDGVKSGIRVYALKKDSDGYVIMGGTTTSVAPVISVTSIKDKVISSITAPDAAEVKYAGTVTIPTTVTAEVDGKEKVLNVISASPEAIDTRTPGETEVTLTVEVPDRHVLGTGVTNTVKFNVVVLPEGEAVELAPFGAEEITAVSGQVPAAVHKFGGEVKRSASFDFDLTVNEVANSLVAINNSANMTDSNYFANSSIFMLINNGKLFVRNGGNNGSGVSVVAGDRLHVSITTDVEAGTFDAVLTDSNGNVVYTAKDYAYRMNTDALDCFVALDNNSKNNTVKVDNFKVTSNSFYPRASMNTVPELRLLEGGFGLAFTTNINVNLNLVEKVGFEYGAYKADKNGNYVIENEDLNVEFQQLATDVYRLVIKDISKTNSVRQYGAKPYVVIGGEKIYGQAQASSLYSALVDSIVNGEGSKVSRYYVDSANEIIAFVGYRNASNIKFPGQAEAEDKIFNSDGTLKQEYVDMGLSLDNVSGAEAVFMALEAVEVEFVDYEAQESEACSDISMELEFTQAI